jgi:hypothetical protein
MMRTLTVDKAAELVLFLGEDMSAAALYELAQEPFDPEHRESSSSSRHEEWRKTGGRRTKPPQVEESLQIHKLLIFGRHLPLNS